MAASAAKKRSRTRAREQLKNTFSKNGFSFFRKEFGRKVWWGARSLEQGDGVINFFINKRNNVWWE